MEGGMKIFLTDPTHQGPLALVVLIKKRYRVNLLKNLKYIP
jgi:hypothetical protein